MKKLNKALAIVLTLILLTSFIPQGLAASNTASITKATITGLTQTNAVLNATVTWTGSKPSQVGFYIGRSTTGMFRVGYDTVLPNSNIIKFWYNLNTECKVKLTPNITYYCKPYIIQSGKYIWGSVVSFRTPPITASFSSIQASNVSSTKAQVSCYLTYNSSVKPSKVGMYLEYGSTRRIVGTDTVLPNTKTFKFWYDLTGLTAKTKYVMQPFAVINGTTFMGSKVSFTTTSTSSSASIPVPTVAKDLFINQLVGDGCSMGAMANMFRMYAFFHGSTYSSITYWSIHNAMVNQFGNYGWNAAFKYGGKSLGYMSVSSMTSVSKQAYLIDKIRERQKNGGVFVYAITPKGNHALLLVGFDATRNEFLCVDSGLNGTSGGNTTVRTLGSSLLGTGWLGYSSSSILGYIKNALWIN